MCYSIVFICFVQCSSSLPVIDLFLNYRNESTPDDQWQFRQDAKIATSVVYHKDNGGDTNVVQIPYDSYNIQSNINTGKFVKRRRRSILSNIAERLEAWAAKLRKKSLEKAKLPPPLPLKERIKASFKKYYNKVAQKVNFRGSSPPPLKNNAKDLLQKTTTLTPLKTIIWERMKMRINRFRNIPEPTEKIITKAPKIIKTTTPAVVEETTLINFTRALRDIEKIFKDEPLYAWYDGESSKEIDVRNRMSKSEIMEGLEEIKQSYVMAIHRQEVLLKNFYETFPTKQYDFRELLDTIEKDPLSSRSLKMVDSILDSIPQNKKVTIKHTLNKIAELLDAVAKRDKDFVYKLRGRISQKDMVFVNSYLKEIRSSYVI